MGHRQRTFVPETVMGNSLHNKIYLGRRPSAFSHKALQAMMILAGTLAGASLIWLVIQALH
jgi:hypothetical protein